MAPVTQCRFGLKTQISQTAFVFEMWKLTFFFKGQGIARSCATVFSIFCWHAFKAAHSRSSAVRCWKRLRIAKDILVIKVNQAGTALTSKNQSIFGWHDCVTISVTHWGGKLILDFLSSVKWTTVAKHIQIVVVTTGCNKRLSYCWWGNSYPREGVCLLQHHLQREHFLPN